MGLFDNLFKTKPDPADEAVVEAAKRIAETEKARLQEAAAKAPASKPAARTGTVSTTKPAGVPPPRAYSPRSLGQVVTPARSGSGKAGETVKGSGIRRIKLSAAEAASKPTEVVLTLEDVLPRIPMELLSEASPDLKRELHFKVEDLSADIARGRAAVALGRIATQVPEIFREPIASDDARQIRLPLQKLVEQIGFLPTKPPPTAAPVLPAAAMGAPAAQFVPQYPRRPSAAPAEIPPIVRLPGEPEKTAIELPEERAASPANLAPATPGSDPSGSHTLRISLPLAVVLERCPRELIVAELPPIADGEQISFAWAPIEKQLETGEVEISSVRFIFALPAHLQGYFEAREGFRVPLPLDEIRRNLPRGATMPERKPDSLSDVTELAPETPPIEEIPAAEVSAAAPPAKPEPPLASEPVEIPSEIFFRRTAPADEPAVEQKGELRSEPPREAFVPAPVVAEPDDIPFAIFRRKPSAPSPEEAAVADVPPREPEPAEEAVAAELVPAEPRPLAADAPPPMVAPATEPFAEITHDESKTAPELAGDVEVVPHEIAFRATEPEPVELSGVTPSFEAPQPLVESEPPAPEPTLELAPPLKVHLPPPIHPFGAIGLTASSAESKPDAAAQDEAPVREERPDEEIQTESAAPPSAPEPPVVAQPPPEVEEAPLSAVIPPIFVPPPLRQAGESLAPEPPAAAPLEPAASAVVHATPPPPNVWMQPPPEVSSRPAAPWPPDVAPPPSPILPVRVVAPPVLRPLVAPPPLFGTGAEERSTLPISEAKPVEPPAPPPPPPLELAAVRDALRLPAEAALADIGRDLVRLPGLIACLVSARHKSAHGGELPDSFDPPAALALARQLSDALEGSAEKLGSGRVQHLTIFADAHCISFFTKDEAVVCAIHRTRAFLPGVRERLAAAASALAQA